MVKLGRKRRTKRKSKTTKGTEIINTAGMMGNQARFQILQRQQNSISTRNYIQKRIQVRKGRYVYLR